MQEAATICPRPCKLTFDRLILKVVSELHVTWATYVPLLVFPGLSVLDLGPMYATDRQMSDVRRASSLNAPTLRAGHNNSISAVNISFKLQQLFKLELILNKLLPPPTLGLITFLHFVCLSE